MCTLNSNLFLNFNCLLIYFILNTPLLWFQNKLILAEVSLTLIISGLSLRVCLVRKLFFFLPKDRYYLVNSLIDKAIFSKKEKSLLYPIRFLSIPQSGVLKNDILNKLLSRQSVRKFVTWIIRSLLHRGISSYIYILEETIYYKPVTPPI